MSEELAYLAGFFDGEGSIYFNSQRKGQPGSLRIAIVQISPEPLLLMSKVFGGNVRGPYSQRSVNQSPYYQWSAYGVKAAETLGALLPWLLLKKEQAVVGIEGQEYFESTKAPRYRRVLAITQKRLEFAARLKSLKVGYYGQARG
jgi:hypothetical protein